MRRTVLAAVLLLASSCKRSEDEAARARMFSPEQPVGERLPYLLGKLKAPRVLERLEQTAATARGSITPATSS